MHTNTQLLKSKQHIPTLIKVQYDSKCLSLMQI